MAECDRHRFSGLELLPTPMLEKIIEQDFKQEADYDQELVDYVLELMVQRAKNETPHIIPDIQSSWNKLQQRLDGEVELGPLPFSTIPEEKIRKSSRVRPFLRYVAVVAACIAIIFGAMITVQAIGIDVFGVLAEWTDSTFRFETAEKKPPSITEDIIPTEDLLSKALTEIGLSTEFAPTWVPPKYELINIDSYFTELHKGIQATYTTPQNSTPLIIQIEEYFDTSFLTGTMCEKSAVNPEFCVKNGNNVYLFENSGEWTAVWSNSKCGVSIFGASSKEVLLTIIHSIKEGIYE